MNGGRNGDFIALVFLLFLSVWSGYAQAPLQEFKLYVSSDPREVIAGRTSDLEIYISNHSRRTFEELTIRVDAPEYVRIRLLDNRIDTLVPGQKAVVHAEIEPKRRLRNRSEAINVTTIWESIYTVDTFYLEITPVPWIWPTLGGILGAAVVVMFVLVFRRVSLGG